MKKLETVIISAIILFTATLPNLAQEKRFLDGFVTQKDGNPVSGVLVNPRGSDISATTDVKGYYKIESVPDSILTLVYSYPEMETVSATIGLYDRIDVQMNLLGSDGFAEISLEDLLILDIVTVSKNDEECTDAPGIVTSMTK